MNKEQLEKQVEKLVEPDRTPYGEGGPIHEEIEMQNCAYDNGFGDGAYAVLELIPQLEMGYVFKYGTGYIKVFIHGATPDGSAYLTGRTPDAPETIFSSNDIYIIPKGDNYREHSDLWENGITKCSICGVNPNPKGEADKPNFFFRKVKDSEKAV